MKRILCIAILCLYALALDACSKQHVAAEPSMMLVVTDESGNGLKGAVAVIYDSYDDWFDMSNPIRAGISDENGHVLFDEMDEIVYFFDVTYDSDYWNYPDGVYRTEHPLKKGYRKVIAVKLYENGDEDGDYRR